ncbi:hypothetical protein AVEN_193190-1 [Araneus ventricosus]|uniref:Uncharacterized protein n=1 Tax=Araneus ventricosus TaxID=182803 RepID=A0A4Y2B355_ARAVE|nr:hypothetical protein AVEN_193190-1 [Araneus ventricosus]
MSCLRRTHLVIGRPCDWSTMTNPAPGKSGLHFGLSAELRGSFSVLEPKMAANHSVILLKLQDCCKYVSLTNPSTGSRWRLRTYTPL